ncbi:MAG: phosphoserine transaminase [Rhodobiaceae bacterium]|nr:phosphoserine transaminase [Rhodobiaceae bacterium]
MIKKPKNKPACLNFSSGPCTKRPGWSLDVLKDALLGRSHRSSEGKLKLNKAIEDTKELLSIPSDYKVGIVPASDTGAIEMAMWNLLGARPVEVLSWEVFGKDWKIDIEEQLKIPESNYHDVEFGLLPDLSKVNFDNDVIFTWNGTTSGVRVPNADWIPDNRKGLTLCDATSAVFAQELDWNKLDATSFSWQKVLGGEAGHGMLILSPRAIEHLKKFTPSWPIPKIFRLTKNGKVIEGVFSGETLNTPSMLCVEDYLDVLSWVKSIGGSKGTIERAEKNFIIIDDWVKKNSWIEFLCLDRNNLSNTSVCLKFEQELAKEDEDVQRDFAKSIGKILEEENVAFDIVNHRNAPPGLRIWCGATVEAGDLVALLPWIDWAYFNLFNK